MTGHNEPTRTPAGSGDALRPSTLKQLEEMVAGALADEAPLELVGNGSKRGYGRPVEAARALALDGLAGVAMYEPEELVMSAGAGTRLAEIEAMLAERQQELAFEPADYGGISGGEPGRQTIGGVFACNLAGPRRLRVGAARDHLLGAQCVTGHGQVIKAGGRVVKNVTGYDLCKLLTGSFGTLAALSQVTFKVLPRAESSQTLLVAAGDEAALLAVLRRATGTAYDVSGAAMLPALPAGRSSLYAVRHPGRPIAAMRLEGPAPSVAYRLEHLRGAVEAPGLDFLTLDDAQDHALWHEIRDVALLTGERPLWRLNLAPTAAVELARWSRELSSERLFDWAGGLVWVAPRPDWPDAALHLRALAARHGGAATLVRGPIELRARLAPFQPQPAPLAALTRRVKTSFDPYGILNPGRMYAGI